MVLFRVKFGQTGPSGPNGAKHLPNIVAQGQMRSKRLKWGLEVLDKGKLG